MKKLLISILLVIVLGTSCTSVSYVRHSIPLTDISQFHSLKVIPADEWKCYARKNGINYRTSKCHNKVTVLGHYPEYVELTVKLKAVSMQIPMEKWDAMTQEEQWQTTTGFFDDMIEAGHVFRLATPLEKARPGSFYIRELNYLFDKGFKLSSDGLWLVR